MRKAGTVAFGFFSNLAYRQSWSDLCYGFAAFWKDSLDQLGLVELCAPRPERKASTLWRGPWYGHGFEIEALLYCRAARRPFAHRRGHKPRLQAAKRRVAPRERGGTEVARHVRDREGTAVATTSVVVCSYTMSRWESLCATLEGLGRQSRPPEEVLVVSDHNPELSEALASIGVGRVLLHTGEHSYAGARETTAWKRRRANWSSSSTTTPSPRRDWLELLVAPLEEPVGGGYGRMGGARRGQCGRLVPEGAVLGLRVFLGRVEAPRPCAIPSERQWPGAGACCQSGRVQRGDRAHGQPGPGDRRLEETLAAIRSTQLTGGTIVHARERGSAPLRRAGRVSFAYLLRRGWGEGMSKSVVRRVSGVPLRDERAHSRRMAAAIATSLASPRRWRTGLFLMAGLGTTAAGYLYGRVTCGLSEPSRPGSSPPSWSLSA